MLGGMALGVLFLVAFLLLDAWVHFGARGRWVGFVMVVGSFAAGLGMAVRSWRRKVSEEAIARRIEKASAGSGNVLISAVQFDRELPADSPVRTAIFNEMRDPFPQVKWEVVFDARLLKRLGLALGAVAVGLFAWAVAEPGYFSNSAARIFLPSAKIAALTRTQMELMPGRDDVVPHGRTFEVKATLHGKVPQSAWLHYREAGSGWQKTLMQREAGRADFAFQWKEVKQPMEYYVQAGDAQSVTFALGVRPRTAVKSRVATVTPPAYTGLPKQEVRDFSVLQNVTPGSTVTVALEFNNPLQEISIADEKAEAIETKRDGESRAEFSVKPFANKALRVQFRDTLGTLDSAPLQISVKADDAPKVVVVDPSEGQQIAAAKGSSLSIRFTAEDAFALGEVAVYRSTDEKEDAVLMQDFPEAAGKQKFEGMAKIKIVPLPGEDRLTFRVVAKDKNDVTGPGVTMSRPVVVMLESKDKLAKAMDEAAAKLTRGLDALIKLQEANLLESKAAGMKKDQGPLVGLVGKQVQIADIARELIAASSGVSPDVHRDLVAMGNKEMKDAVLALRNADGAKDAAREKFLASGIVFEAMILARLQGAPAMVEEDKKQAEIADLISGVEDLLKKEREILKDTKASGESQAQKISERQDALADRASQVRANIEKDTQNQAIGDADFRKRLTTIVAMFGQMKIYEDMLAAAEKLSQKQVPPATEIEQRVVSNLAKMVELLNQWQLADGGKKTEDLKAKVEALQDKLNKLAEIQREVLEKTKELARKSDFRPEDVATAKEFTEQKDLMKDVLEQMTTDLQAFPETKAGNEMKGEIVSIFEDVEQADKEDVAANKLKPEEIAVQKEQGILDAIEAAKKIAADMEMWLPNKNETQKWLMENFDKTEMPEMPMLPLADAFEDLVGNLLEAQKDIEEEIQDAASNQAMAMNPANGWEVRDGPMPGFGAQGRSGNERPNHNEQMGRSSGGREGMSDGEMAAGKTQNLEGDTPTTRRTRDAMQQGQVEDEGGIGKTRATGGGKASGFSDRQGMEGNAPLRASNAGKRAGDAASVAQAQLAERTAKKVAEAQLLYIRGADQLGTVAGLMDQNAQAIRDGRLKDSVAIHQKIMGRLKELKGGVASDEVVTFSASDGAKTQEKQLLGGQEGEAPTAYKEMVADYFRSLVQEK